MRVGQEETWGEAGGQTLGCAMHLGWGAVDVNGSVGLNSVDKPASEIRAYETHLSAIFWVLTAGEVRREVQGRSGIDEE